MKSSATIGELAKALCLAQSDFGIAIKSKENPFFKSKYADLQTIWGAVKPALTKNGLSVVQLPGGGDGTAICLTTVLLHSSGEWISDDGVVMRPAKQDPQGIAAALTYAKRAGLQAVLGVVADEDDDGNSISAPGNTPKTDARPKSAPTAKGVVKDEQRAAPVLEGRENEQGRARAPNGTSTSATATTTGGTVSVPGTTADPQEIAARMLADCSRGFASKRAKLEWVNEHRAAKEALPAPLQKQILEAWQAAPTDVATTKANQ